VLGNIIRQPTRTGLREIGYFGSGLVKGVVEPGRQARFRYDAFGQVEELDVQGTGAIEKRHDRHYGELIERHDETVGTATKSVIVRQFPGPNGLLASQPGPGNEWVFHFGEQRGNRFFTDANGAFVQDVNYQPFGEAKSTGAPVDSPDYTHYQWNGAMP
jgi:hypothetical protein